LAVETTVTGLTPEGHQIVGGGKCVKGYGSVY